MVLGANSMVLYYALFQIPILQYTNIYFLLALILLFTLLYMYIFKRIFLYFSLCFFFFFIYLTGILIRISELDTVRYFSLLGIYTIYRSTASVTSWILDIEPIRIDTLHSDHSPISTLKILYIRAYSVTAMR